MRTKVLTVALCCAATGGCATLPLEQVDGVSIDHVISRIECELGAALAAYPKLDTWALGTTITLQVDETNSVVPSATFANLSPTGIVAVNVGGGVTRNATRTSLVKTFMYVAEAADGCPERPGSPLEDSLGLAHWVNRVLESDGRNDYRFNKEQAIGYSLDFSLTLTGGVTPTFAFRDGSGAAGLSAVHKGTHSLDLALLDTGVVHVRKRVVVTRPPPLVVAPPPPGTFAPLAVPAERRKRTGRVVTEKRRVDPATRLRLNSILQELQFRTLLPRR